MSRAASAIRTAPPTLARTVMTVFVFDLPARVTFSERGG
jgi:hypothetical protein